MQINYVLMRLNARAKQIKEVKAGSVKREVHKHHMRLKHLKPHLQCIIN